MTNAADSGTLKFGANSAFQLELRRRVHEYFRNTGRRQRDCWQMYVKTAILVGWLAVSYLLLVFAADAWWQGVPLAVLLGFAAAGIGFNVQHDGGHHAYSDYRSVNKLMAMTLDMLAVRTSGTGSTPSSITHMSMSPATTPTSTSAASPG
jgi:linoleoyl-CoA desaturase